MLAQSFMSAADLTLSDAQYDALKKTLVVLETEQVVHVAYNKDSSRLGRGNSFTGHFNMIYWRTQHTIGEDCGTVACICGTAEIIGDVELQYHPSGNLQRLFMPFPVLRQSDADRLAAITPEQAARALRNYLTTGQARWAEIL